MKLFAFQPDSPNDADQSFFVAAENLQDAISAIQAQAKEPGLGVEKKISIELFDRYSEKVESKNYFVFECEPGEVIENSNN